MERRDCGDERFWRGEIVEGEIVEGEIVKRRDCGEERLLRGEIFDRWDCGEIVDR